MPKEIIKADKNLRRRTFYIIIGMALGGFWAIYYFESFFKEITIFAKTSPEDTLERISSVFYIVTWIATITTIGIGVFIFNLSLRIFRSQCFPPPGMRVIKDTKRITGQKAMTRAIIGVIFSIVIIICGILFHYLAYELIQSLSAEKLT